MYNNYHYYLIDTVSETIIAQFFAKTEVMAKRIVSGFDFKKANLAPDDCVLYKDNEPSHQYETASEVISAKLCGDCSDLLSQNVLEFEKNDA